MYTLKSTLKRGMTLSAGLGLVVASFASMATPVFADALNPLTERSLTLSSSSPGWANTDGSGNSTYAPPNSGANGYKTGNYFDFKVSSAGTPKTMTFQYCTKSAGDCFIPGDLAVSSATPDFAGKKADLNVTFPSATEISTTDTALTGTITTTSSSPTVTGVGTAFTTELRVGSTFKTAGNNLYTVKSIANNTSLTLTAAVTTGEAGVTFSMSDFDQVIDSATGMVRAVPGYTNNNPKYISSGLNNDAAEAAKNVAGNFVVMSYDGSKWVPSTGWAASAANVNDPADTRTTNNYIILTKAAGVTLTAGQQVKVLFFATNNNYITNPGSGAFFVKINTYSAEYAATPTLPQVDITGLMPATDDNVIDGGVTVANVMNQSIQITTKVLETMQFSVGTVDPTTLTKAELSASTLAKNTHGTCDTILMGMTSTDPQNVLQLGDQTSESSLSTDKTYATHSYWRLSSNSSAGATVYYSGHTLSNTVGDEIKPIGIAKAESAQGTEQFGLALSTATLTTSGTTDPGSTFNTATYGVNYVQDRQSGKNWENAADNGKLGVDVSTLSDLGATDAGANDYTGLNGSYHTPRLDPLTPAVNYADGSGTINGTDSLDLNGVPATGGSIKAKFAFNPMSDTVPEPIASENSQVVDCVTAKMRYVANIAATTPAGIYTTKINYIAAPQY